MVVGSNARRLAAGASGYVLQLGLAAFALAVLAIFAVSQASGLERILAGAAALAVLAHAVIGLSKAQRAAERARAGRAVMESAIEAIEGAGRTTVAVLEALKSEVIPSLNKGLATAQAMAADRRLSASVRGRVADIGASSDAALSILQAFVAPAQPTAQSVQAVDLEPAYVATAPAEAMPRFRPAEPEFEFEFGAQAELGAEFAPGETAEDDEPSEAEPIFAQSAPAHALQSLDGLRVLVGEANGVHQLVLRTILAQFGAEAEIFGDGIEVMQAWREGGWDLVLLDVQMPRMDGFAAAEMIRSVERRFGWSSTPIVALTPDASPRMTAECAEAGMSACVAKPIEGAALFAAIEAAFATPADAPMIEDLPVRMARVA